MSSLKRRLAAIVFTDIVGFTNLSSKDEEGAYKLYYITGEISSGDRFYSIKYILGPAFLIFFVFTFGIIQSLLF